MIDDRRPGPVGRSSAGDDLDASVTRMARIGSCHSPSFSPDGGRLAVVSDLGGVPQVWIVPVGGAGRSA